MKDHNPHDPLNMIGEAYELLLEKTMHNLHIIDGKSISANDEQNHHMTLHVKNNPFSVSTTRHDTQNPFNASMLKLSLVKLVINSADRTTIDLLQLQSNNLLPDEYHAEELVSAGTLYCDHCGMPVEYTMPSFLETCRHCGYNTFRKLH